MSIPASEIVSIIPGVIGTGGNPLSLNAMFITKHMPGPMSGVQSFTSAEDVKNIYGRMSTEYKAAEVYFSGFTNCTTLPSRLFIMPMSGNAQPAMLKGATLTPPANGFDSIPTGLTLSIDGKQVSVTISKAVTSYSELSDAVTASLGKAGTCYFNSMSSMFIIASETKSSQSMITTATGELAKFMGLTSELGAKAMPGSDGVTADNVVPVALEKESNFSTIMCMDNFSVDELVEISSWVAQQNSRFMHVIYRQGDINGDILELSNQISGAKMSGTIMFYGDYTHGAFACAYPASLNFNELNGRTNFAFRNQSGLYPSVDNSALASQLRDLGFNYYGAYATANDRFVFAYAGNVTGDFKWVDSYVNQIYFNAQFQLALMSMLTSYKLIPYNATGKAIHRAACQDVINQMANFGALQPGVNLSEQQKTQINIEAGYDAASQLQTTGYALLIGDATSQERGNRGSLPMKFWYADGGSVQSVNLPSINVQ